MPVGQVVVCVIVFLSVGKTTAIACPTMKIYLRSIPMTPKEQGGEEEETIGDAQARALRAGITGRQLLDVFQTN